MKKNITVREAIIKALKSYGALKPKDLIVKTGRPANQIYTMVSAMTKDGLLRKHETGHIRFAKAPALTALKPDLPMAIDTVDTLTPDQLKNASEYISKRKATGLEMSMGKKISALEKEIDSLQRDLTRMSVNYYDSLAVIKYLESKLISIAK